MVHSGWSGGSYLVTRWVRMHIETWDRTPPAEQETIIGLDKGEGAGPGRTNVNGPEDHWGSAFFA